jgi:competence protein ComEA
MTVSFSTAPDPSRGPRWRVGVGAAVVLVLVALVITVVVSALSTAGGAGMITVTSPPSSGASQTAVGGPDGSSAGGADAQGGALFIHVHGAVVSPGLYELPSGARVVDVVAAAGGFADGADQAGVNLARVLVDGEQLRVPVVGEPPDEAGAGAGGGAGGAAGPVAGGAPAGGAVDLNRADDTALQTLPGVGPATAGAILDWREQNGAFRSVDDLLGVPGIGEKTLERLRPLVTV